MKTGNQEYAQPLICVSKLLRSREPRGGQPLSLGTNRPIASNVKIFKINVVI